MMETAWEIAPLLLKGTGVTLQVALLSAMVTIVCAVVAGLCRLAANWWLRCAVVLYVELFRGTSLLVQLIWFYFALPLMGIAMPKLLAAVLALGLNYGAYGSEIVRSSILAVPAGQREAALALNFGRRQMMMRVIFPQAFVRMLPPLGNLMIELVKGTSLVYFIALSDLLFNALVLRMNRHDLTGWILFLVMILYFLINALIGWSARRMERSMMQGRT